jgi:DNA phosphorothioation-dependent restriction protein DptH
MNRHMLITGKSGAGKSYLLQRLVRQAATKQITTIIFHNQGDLPDVPSRKIIDIAADKPSVGSSSEMDFYDALKIAALLQQVLRLRNTQANTVRQCYVEYVKRTSQQSLFGFFKSFKEIAKDLELTNYSSIQAKLGEILDSKAFSAKPINWAEHEGATLILDFRGCSDYVNLFQMQAELLLRDLYCYKKRNPSSPLIAIVDEFQKMDTGDNSALAVILREGRKYGWSLWLASQLAESGNGAQLKKLFDQASLQLYFSQGAKGNRSIGKCLGRRLAKRIKFLKSCRD